MTQQILSKLNTTDGINVLVNGIRRYHAEAGLGKAVLGMSGGIDSAVTAALLVKALGAENVLLYNLPFQTSDPQNVEHAEQQCERLGIEMQTISIEQAVRNLFFDTQDDLPYYCSQITDSALKLRVGNACARMRMIVQFDQAAKHGALVAGTENKTENMIGYATLFGDQACSYNVLGTLYKCEVRAVARALDVLPEIIDKAPSADLWINQTDEGELGMLYDEIDSILFQLFDEGKRAVDVEAAPQKVEAVLRRYRQSAFKRRCCSPIDIGESW